MKEREERSKEEAESQGWEGRGWAVWGLCDGKGTKLLWVYGGGNKANVCV